MEQVTDKEITNNLEIINTQKFEKHKRVQYIDVARGIAIILMVIGHVLELGWKKSTIFSFHMPLFIIVSGYFYRDRSFKETIKNIFLKLILPYLICTLIMQIIQCNSIQSLTTCFIDWIKQITFSYSYWRKINFCQSAPALGVLWFLPLLAVIRLIFIAMKKFSKNNSIKLFFLVVLTSYIGYILGIKAYWLPFSLDVAMFSLIFYYIGYILNKTKRLEEILSNNTVMIIILLIWILGIKFSWIELAMRRYPDGAFSILSATCGTMVVFKISQIIEKYLKHLCNILAWFGKNSMLILLFHHIESNLVKYNSLLVNNNESIYKIEICGLKILIVTLGTETINIVEKAFSYIGDIGLKNKINKNI